MKKMTKTHSYVDGECKYYILYILDLLLLYNSSVLDIEHSPYYIALGSPQTHKMI